MNYLTDAFYWISTGLLVPVMVFLLLGFVYSLFLVGGFYGYYTDRQKFKKEIETITGDDDAPSIRTLEFDRQIRHHPGFLRVLRSAQKNSWSEIYTAKALADFELSAEKQLEKPKTLMRVGPMLGLMGTLIPMGPALVGLAVGDIATMAMNMQVAFSTTVIGVFLGGTGFIIYSVRKRWFTDDFYKLQFIIDLARDEQIES
ncbi:MAG: MotA/TolQ/ExbB proton channel family protein [Verrucomicrobiota bacterium]